MSYDNMILGVGNINHPANQREDQLEEFESNNLSKCLDYAKETKDFEYIENAIIDQNVIIENAISEIDFLIEVYSNNTFTKNKLLKIKRNLNSNQK